MSTPEIALEHPAAPSAAAVAAAAGPAVSALALAASRAKAPEAMGANHPILLTDPQLVAVVIDGAVDLFSVPLRDNKVAGARSFIGQVGAGGLLFGMAAPDGSQDGAIGVLAVGMVSTTICKLDQGWFAQQQAAPEQHAALAAGVDAWISALSGAFAQDVPGGAAIALLPGKTAALRSGQAASPGQTVVWTRTAAGGVQLDGDPEQPAVPPDQWFPLARSTTGNTAWLRATGDVTVTVCGTDDLLKEGALYAALEAFHGPLAASIARQHLTQLAAEAAQLAERRAFAQGSTAEAVRDLGTAMRERRRAAVSRTAAVYSDSSALFAACQLIGEPLEIDFVPPSEADRLLSNRDPLEQIAFASRIRLRRVHLPAEWWRRDSGPFLGFRQDGSPVALLPRSPSRYEAVDPVTKERVRVDAAYADGMQEEGYIFYRRLGDNPIGVVQTIRFALFGLKADLWMIFFTGLGLALLGLLVPIASGWLVNTVIPLGRRQDLVAMGVVLVATAISSLLLTIVEQFAVLRLQTKSTAALSGATWDRLLGLPAAFFRNYNAGELANRAYGISRIRQLVSDATVTAIISGLFSLVNFALLFYYSPQLALVACLLALVILAMSLSTSYYQLKIRRKVSNLQGAVSGLVLQLLNGVTKLRVAGAEAGAFQVWADLYSQQQRYTYLAGTIDNVLAVFNTMFPLISSVCLFAAIGYWLGGTTFSTGVFVAFNVAFTQFLSAALKEVNAFTSVLEAVPYYERAKPILDEMPEVTEGKSNPGVLSGKVDVNHIGFSYDVGGPLVLRDVSLHAAPGEMVALVGPSGAGKSTIIRMLLGFDAPLSGSVYYDSQDLKSLNVQAVRRQIGVVLQDGKVMPGTVLDNIIGQSLLSEEDAWEAARIAALDDDIRRMPMGMQTVVAEGGTTFSGGQMQRLMIARAVVGKPRIMIFDEATSALDNEVQARVTQNLDAMQVTRIIIAHRLSTIIRADRIFVLDQGVIAQIGTYTELVQQEGIFRELALRQLA